jgi:hypothetical protein
MISGYAKIVEERILKAQQQGEFENLEGSGLPLEFEDVDHVPEDLRLAYKILKNADCLPPEVELRKEIERTEDLLEAMTDTMERYRILKKLNLLIMKLNLGRKGDARFDIPERYAVTLGERMCASGIKKT